MSHAAMEMRILSLASLIVSSALFIIATAYFVKAKKRLSASEKESLRIARGYRGKVDACLSLAALAMAVAGTMYFGIESIPLVSLPLFVVAFGSDFLDLLQILRSKDELSPMARKAVLIPSAIVLTGMTFWTLGCLSYLAVSN